MIVQQLLHFLVYPLLTCTLLVRIEQVNMAYRFQSNLISSCYNACVFNESIRTTNIVFIYKLIYTPICFDEKNWCSEINLKIVI